MRASTGNDAAMTVEELIELLAVYPADLRVVVDGYEDGYDNVHPDKLSVISIRPNKEAHWWNGENDDIGQTPSKHDFTALRIARRHGDSHD